MGLGWQVIAAARARDSGKGMDEILKIIQHVQSGMVYYITLDTIDYLSKGGRIADAVRFVGSFLKIKPLIYVKPDSGSVGASIPSRSRKAALEGLYKEFFKHFLPGQTLHLTILHNQAFDEARGLAEKVKKEYSPKELFITITSPVLGAHTGPGAVALVGYAE
jgi:DegV family protein with EDD domain